MSAFATVNAIFVCMELVAMIANSILAHKGGLIAIVPGIFGFAIILNLHNVTIRSVASKGVGA